MLLTTNFCMASSWATESLHVKAIAVGKGKVYLHRYRINGGTKEYGTIDRYGNYIPTEVCEWGESTPIDAYLDHQYVFSEYGAYAYIAAAENDEYRYVQLYAIPDEGYELIGVYGPNEDGTAPDYDKPYMACRNALQEDGITPQPDSEGLYADPEQLPAIGILPESENNPNPVKHFNAAWNFSDQGIVEQISFLDYEHVTARTDWNDVNTIFFVVFGNGPEGVEHTYAQPVPMPGTFNLLGVQVSDDYHGIVIRNGQKHIQ